MRGTGREMETPKREREERGGERRERDLRTSNTGERDVGPGERQTDILVRGHILVADTIAHCRLPRLRKVDEGNNEVRVPLPSPERACSTDFLAPLSIPVDDRALILSRAWVLLSPAVLQKGGAILRRSPRLQPQPRRSFYKKRNHGGAAQMCGSCESFLRNI